MGRRRSYLFGLLILLLAGSPSRAQKSVYDSLLTEKVKVENPVYKPVIGLGGGAFSFLGDVKGDYWHLFSNNPGVRLTVSTFLDKKHFYVLDFHIATGSLSATQGTQMQHLNFRTDLTLFGLSVRYALAHLYRRPTRVSPYVSAGFETFHFNSKGDLKDAEGRPYLYPGDGTIRDPEGNITTWDHVYESDLRTLDLYGLGNYAQYGFAFPLEVGIEAFLTRRVSLHVGTSVHLTTTDLIDNVNKQSAGVTVNNRNDYFTYTFFSVHFDLFSDPEYEKVKKVFAELPPDDILSGDEDHDWVLDLLDECPGTPPGVKVDTLGCPLDSDHDGVPDYLDKDPHTRHGVVVDDEGKPYSDTTLTDFLREKGAPAQDMDYYLTAKGYSSIRQSACIPARFREVDANGDGEISFDELLKAIDDYFDYHTFLSLEDIYDLMNFYFSQ
jgi:hypothetical protein